MDLKDGKIIIPTSTELKEFKKEPGTKVQFENPPKKNCKDCLGRGSNRVLVPVMIPCKCTKTDTHNKEFYAALTQTILKTLEKMGV